MQSHVHFFPLFFFHLCSRGCREENKHTEEEIESEKEDSEEEMEASRAEQASGGLAAEGDAAPALTKAQARELRRVKKHDHSWLSGLLHTST